MSGDVDDASVRVVGIDGGGSATRAALVDGSGCVLGHGRSGSGNLHVVGREGVRRHVAEAVHRARAEAGAVDQPLAAVFLGMAGCSGAREAEALVEIVVELNLAPRARVHVDHDLRVALAGALAGAPGVVVVAGTGSAAYGRNLAGRAWRAGGYGPIFDDAGSAWDVGRRALIATLRAGDGRSAPGALSRAIEAEVGAAGARSWAAAAERGRSGRAAIARLAPLVMSLAERGDETAAAIVQRAGDELVALAAAVAVRLGLQQGQVALVGGAAEAAVLRAAFERALPARLPAARITRARLAPCLGAALLALDAAGRPAGETGLANLLAADLD